MVKKANFENVFCKLYTWDILRNSQFEEIEANICFLSTIRIAIREDAQTTALSKITNDTKRIIYSR